MREELLKGLTEDQIAKIKECKTQEEVLKLAKEEGIELTNEQLEAVSGGCFSAPKCPDCSSANVDFLGRDFSGDSHYICRQCNRGFII